MELVTSGQSCSCGCACWLLHVGGRAGCCMWVCVLGRLCDTGDYVDYMSQNCKKSCAGAQHPCKQCKQCQRSTTHNHAQPLTITPSHSQSHPAIHDCCRFRRCCCCHRFRRCRRCRRCCRCCRCRRCRRCRRCIFSVTAGTEAATTLDAALTATPARGGHLTLCLALPPWAAGAKVGTSAAALGADKSDNCGLWAKQGLCDTGDYVEYMSLNCKKSCADGGDGA